MERRFVWVGVAVLVVLAVAVGAAYLLRDTSYRGIRYTPATTAFDFQLESGSGTQVSLHDFRGKLVFLFFGFTNCMDICPTTLAILSQVTADLGEQASQVQVVYVTVDPHRDTPQRMQEYVTQFDPTFVGLSGGEEILQPVWDAYGVFREIDMTAAGHSGDYGVTHSTRLYLIDMQGRLFLSYDYGTPKADILHDARLFLGNK